MKVRYCETFLHKLMPCQVSWSQHGGEYSSCCADEPMKECCHNIVDDKDLHCPYCGSKLVTGDTGRIFRTLNGRTHE